MLRWQAARPDAPTLSTEQAHVMESSEKYQMQVCYKYVLHSISSPSSSPFAFIGHTAQACEQRRNSAIHNTNEWFKARGFAATEHTIPCVYRDITQHPGERASKLSIPTSQVGQAARRIVVAESCKLATNEHIMAC
jgi:hypothetical protein